MSTYLCIYLNKYIKSLPSNINQRVTRVHLFGLVHRSWFFWFVISLAMNCSYVIYLVCCTINVDGFNVFYVLALLQAFAFGVLSWALTATIVSITSIIITQDNIHRVSQCPSTHPPIPCRTALLEFYLNFKIFSS